MVRSEAWETVTVSVLGGFRRPIGKQIVQTSTVVAGAPPGKRSKGFRGCTVARLHLLRTVRFSAHAKSAGAARRQINNRFENASLCETK